MSKKRDVMGRRRLLSFHILCSALFVLYPLLVASLSYCDVSAELPLEESDTGQVSGVKSGRPAIVDEIKAEHLPKTTKLEIVSDRPLKIAQMKLYEGGAMPASEGQTMPSRAVVLRMSLFNATTSLPNFVAVNKGVVSGVQFDTEGDMLKVSIGLTQKASYNVESVERGLAIVFQNPILERLVSLNINNEPLTTVLLMLFIEYGANIVAGSDVSGNVTAHLVDVPLKDALDKLLEAEGYGYVEKDGLIQVMSATELAQKGVSEALSISQAAPETHITEVPETKQEVFQLKFARASDMEQIAQKLIGNDGNLVSDLRTNSLILISTPENIEKVGRIIAMLDIETPKEASVASRQASGEGTTEESNEESNEEAVVELVKRVFRLNYASPEKASAIIQFLLSDAGAVEAIKEESKQADSSGGASAGAAGGGLKLGEAVGRGGYIVVSDTPEIIKKIEEEILKFDVPIPQVEIEAYIVEGTLSNNNDLGINWTAISEDEDMQFMFSRDVGAILTRGIISAEKFTGILNALATNSKLNVLSNPRITTLENQPAVFHSGDKIPYNRIVIDQGIQQVDTVFEDVGIVLTATPQVKENDMISLLLATSVSSEGGFTPSGQPRIATRTTQSQVLVKSGDTAVIAGLISEKASVAVSKVPIIGDIPFIGRIFSSKREAKQKSEVTIFITPRIIP